MGQVILSHEELQAMAKRIAHEIVQTVKNDKKIPVLVGVMKGSLNFMFEIMNNINIPVYTDYIQISSYEGSSRGNSTRLLKDLSFDCEGRSVILIEDIVDTGHSMKYLVKHFEAHNPKKVYVCAMFDKKNARQVDVPIDFCGKILERNDFLIGFGLDYNELERNVPYVYSATKEDLERLDKALQQDKENK